jgi:nitroreductase / dihydropteridine reductase
MEYKDIVMSRYAARSFSDERIPDGEIAKLLELVRWTPSALNVQPWRLKVVTEAPAKEALAAAAWGQRQVAECSHLLVLCAENDLEAQIRRLETAYVAEGIEEKGRIAIEHLRQIFAMMPSSSLPELMKNQVFILLGTALLGAKSLGIDSCPVTGFDGRKVAQALALPPHIVPVALCPLGYGTERPQARVRVPLSELLLP